MKIYNGFNDSALKPRKRAIAIGVFDGVHLGHQKILKRTLLEAREKNLRSMVITFEPHPNKILRPAQPHPIVISLLHRLRFFEAMGIDEVIVIRFNREFSRISREVFLEKFLIGRAGMRSLVLGHDFCFGRHGKGNSLFLEERAHRLGFNLSFVPPLKYHGHIISSTLVRRLIEEGDLLRASKMLGRPVSVHGDVVRGRGRGEKMGFPTANLDPHHETLPPPAVYAAWGRWKKRILKAVVHIGERPTFAEKEKSLEAHFLDFHKNLYGEEIELFFVKKLRGIRRFKNSRRLSAAISADIQKAGNYLKKIS